MPGAHQHLTILVVQSLAVDSAQIVMCIGVVYMRSVESWLSETVNVALRVVSVILLQPIAFHMTRRENLRLVHTHCTKIRRVTGGVVPDCARLSEARDGFQTQPMWFDVKSN